MTYNLFVSYPFLPQSLTPPHFFDWASVRINKTTPHISKALMHAPSKKKRKEWRKSHHPWLGSSKHMGRGDSVFSVTSSWGGPCMRPSHTPRNAGKAARKIRILDHLTPLIHPSAPNQSPIHSVTTQPDCKAHHRKIKSPIQSNPIP